MYNLYKNSHYKILVLQTHYSIVKAEALRTKDNYLSVSKR